MNSINRTLKYQDLYLIHKNLDNIKDYELPDGYRFVFYKNGDEKDWVNIELLSGEFISFKEGMEAFEKYYGMTKKELEHMCIFIENEQGEKIATSTAFYLEEPIGEITGNVHWVAIKQEYQGKGLAKPLISFTLKQMRKLGHLKTLLHTQTHTWLAVKIYLDMGFEPYQLKEYYDGWRMIKTLTNHKKLENIPMMNEEEMVNPLYKKINTYLLKKYTEPFTYKIWDEQKKKIGVYKNAETHIYDYTYDGENLEIIMEQK